jgi:hypothetical protein
MSVVDALSQTAAISFIIGLVLGWLGGGIWFINENRKVGLPILAVGVVLGIAAIAAWIACIWMQVKP